MARSIYGKKNYGYNEVNINQKDMKQDLVSDPQNGADSFDIIYLI